MDRLHIPGMIWSCDIRVAYLFFFHHTKKMRLLQRSHIFGLQGRLTLQGAIDQGQDGFLVSW
jgi:hypothetical protein